MNIITKWVLENSRKYSSSNVLYIANTIDFFVTNVTNSCNARHFFHPIKFFNVLNYESKQCVTQGFHILCGYSIIFIMPINLWLLTLLIITCMTLVGPTSFMTYLMWPWI
jgi:hypothetical protein